MSTNVKIFIFIIAIVIGIKMTVASSEAVLGFVISERCEQTTQNYLSKWKELNINISYHEIDNKHGGFYTYFTKFVSLKSSKHNKQFLEGIMNGALVNCGRDGVVESDLNDKHLITKIKNYVDVLKKKGIKGSLIIEVKDSQVLIHENSKHSLD